MTLLSRSKHLLHTAHALTFRRAHPGIITTSIFQHHSTAAMSSMSARLKGKTILITGASSGIGRSCAFEFAKTSPDDLKLILTARRTDKLQEVAAEIGNFAPGVQVLPVKLDVSKPEEVSALVGNLPKEFREVDVLVNNAYVLSPTPFYLFLFVGIVYF
jgi:3-hydroxy acid dehydrogenase/malonic semialdehyde reductase